jgi:hypothetical protein
MTEAITDKLRRGVVARLCKSAAPAPVDENRPAATPGEIQKSNMKKAYAAMATVARISNIQIGTGRTASVKPVRSSDSSIMHRS